MSGVASKLNKAVEGSGFKSGVKPISQTGLFASGSLPVSAATPAQVVLIGGGGGSGGNPSPTSPRSSGNGGHGGMYVGDVIFNTAGTLSWSEGAAGAAQGTGGDSTITFTPPAGAPEAVTLFTAGGAAAGAANSPGSPGAPQANGGSITVNPSPVCTIVRESINRGPSPSHPATAPGPANPHPGYSVTNPSGADYTIAPDGVRYSMGVGNESDYVSYAGTALGGPDEGSPPGALSGIYASEGGVCMAFGSGGRSTIKSSGSGGNQGVVLIYMN